MQVLLIVTLIYAAVLVIAVAASLVAILVYLRRIGDLLAEARGALAQVQEQTQPLEAHLSGLGAIVGETAQQAHDSAARLQEAEAHIAAMAERLEPADLAR